MTIRDACRGNHSGSPNLPALELVRKLSIKQLLESCNFLAQFRLQPACGGADTDNGEKQPLLPQRNLC